MHTNDVIVIGGGPAGLQAALTLGRMRRPVTLIDSGAYRNDPAHAMQNLIGHDGQPPAELRAAARVELARYATVTVLDATVAHVEATGAALDEQADAFRVVLEDDAGGQGGHLADGAPSSDAAGTGGSGTTLGARRLVLATGAADALPAIPGLAERFGDRVAHCPYCHGFELAGGPIAILGAGPHVPMQAGMLARLATRVVVLLDGAELPPPLAAALARLRAEVVPERVLGVRDDDGAVAGGIAVELEGADAVPLSGLLVAPAWSPAAPFAEQLGLDRSEIGAVLVDGFGRSSRPGVVVAGDLAQAPGFPVPVSSVAVAIASGQVAASLVDRELALLDAGLPLPF